MEDLTVEDLAKPEAYATVFERLDAAFKFDAMTELPSDFESYFVKMQRRNSQTLQEYQAEYLHTERRLTMVHKIELPEKIRAWWFLRWSGLTRDHRQLTLTQLGDSNLTLDKAIKAMNFIIGQDSKVDGASSRWNKGSTSYKTNAYLAEDDEAWPDDEVYLEWDDYEAEGDEVLDGDETYYYDAENDTNPIDNAFNVDEYDDVFASYIDAKNHLNRMRTSRGSVVAMVQQPHRDGGKGGKSKARVAKEKEHLRAAGR